MNELKMRGMKSDASNSSLRGLGRVVLSVADDGMADGGKLHPDLVLQSRLQRDSDERSGPKRAFDGIPKLSPSSLGVTRRGQSLKHSFSSKVVNERRFFGAEMPANDCEILPHRTVSEKLSNQCVSIPRGFRKKQNAGGKTIDAMYDKGALSPRVQFCGKQRPCGRRVGACHRHSRKSGRFIEGHHDIVFVEDGKIPCETRISPILLS